MICMYIYIYIYIYSFIGLRRRDLPAPRNALQAPPLGTGQTGTSPSRYLVFFVASIFRMCLDCEVLKGMLPWRTRYP